MSLRTKTVEYVFAPRTTALDNATRHDFSAITLYLPETASRTFRSVFVHVFARDASSATSSRGSITSFTVGIKLGATAFSDAANTNNPADTGEQFSVEYLRDVTSYFTSNFGSGGSQTCQVGVEFDASATEPTLINICAKVLITYEWDDASQDTRVKTVRIPLESPTGNSPNTLTEIGTNQVPALDSFLPEASKTYRQIWFEIETNEGENGATDGQFGFALDSESEVNDGTHELANASGIRYLYHWIRNDMATNAAHAFLARTTSANMLASALCVTLCVTYEYSHTSSSSVLNSLLIPFGFPGACSDGSTEAGRAQVEFWVEEPATVALVHSAVRCYPRCAGSIATTNVRCGSQSFRTYTQAGGSTVCGATSLQHRFDSGGAQGSGITFARGKNLLTIDLYVSSPASSQSHSGAVLLNYTSGIATGGDGTHNHTTAWFGSDLVVVGADRAMNITPTTPVIPETSYWLNDYGIQVHYSQSGGTDYGYTMEVQCLSGEGSGAGWDIIAALASSMSPERGIYPHWASRRDLWNHYPGDPRSMRNPETSRVWRETNNDEAGLSMTWLTYHAITFEVSGTISGSAGGTVNIALHDATTGKLLGTTSRTGNGSFSFTWYDDAHEVYAVAREDGTHVGRSDNDTAG